MFYERYPLFLRDIIQFFVFLQYLIAKLTEVEVL